MDNKLGEMTYMFRKPQANRNEEKRVLAQRGNISHNGVNIFAQDWSFAASKTNELTHTIHPYTAKFVPMLTQVLLDFFTTENDVILDPFCGCGTALLEAKKMNRNWIGTDISPLACLISKAKLTNLTDSQIKKALKIEKDARAEIEKNYGKLKGNNPLLEKYPSPNIPNKENWFTKYALIELSTIKSAIKTVDDEQVKDFLLVVFSSIITLSSNQDSETRYCINREKKIDKYFAINQFRDKLLNAIGKIQSLDIFRTEAKGKVNVDDARELSKVASDSVDYVVTSPPYLNAWDYNLYHRFRFFWLDFDVEKYKKNEIGAHLAHSYSGDSPQWFFKDMEKCLVQLHRVLKKGKFCSIVIGNSTVKGKKINSVEAIVQMGKKIGLSHAITIERPIVATKKRMNSTTGRIATESIIILQKSPSTTETQALYAFTFQDYVTQGLERDLAVLQLRRFFGKDSLQETEKKIIFTGTLDDNALCQLRKIAFFKKIQVINKEKIVTVIPDQAFFEYSDFLSKFADDEEKIDYYLHKIVENHFGHKVSKYLAHSFHEYIGRFYPQIIRSLVFSYDQDEGRVLDPFNGSGTTQIECSLMSIDSIGVENNPLQAFLSNVKLKARSIAIEDIDKGVVRLQKRIKESLPAEPYPENLLNWFNKDNLHQLFRLKNAINAESKGVKEFYLLCLSSITKEVSHWVPGQARVRKRKTLLQKLDVYEKFFSRVKEYRNLIKIFQIMNVKLQIENPNSYTLNGDSRYLSDIKSGQFKLAITSPPYANALPYIETDRLPAQLLGFFDNKNYLNYIKSEIGNREISSSERTALEKEIFSNYDNTLASPSCKKLIMELMKRNGDLPKNNFRRKDHASVLYKYYADMNKVLKEVHRLLTPNGFFIIVIGNNKLRAGEKWLEVESDKYFIEMAETMGFSVEGILKKDIQRTTNFFSKIKKESIIILRKVK